MQGATTQRRKPMASREGSTTPTIPSQPIPVATVRRRKWGTSPFDENWLNLDCCGLICALITYGLHVYGCYAVCLVLIPPWMSVTEEGGPRQLTLTGRFHQWAFVSIAVMAILSHFKAMTTDPGAVPPDAKPLPDPEQKEEADAENPTILISPLSKGNRLCRRCHAFKPHRAHHCSVCKRCIIKMDHHCPWVNNCVGIGNHKYFLLFVFYTFLSCIYTMTLVVWRFVLCMHHSPRSARSHAHCLDQPNHLLNILGLVVEAMLFGMFTSCMIVDQWDVVMSNITHIDRLKGDLHGITERVPGVTEVFGAGRRGRGGTSFRPDWLSPFASVCFPSSIKDEIMGFCRPCCNNSKRQDSGLVELASPGRMVRSVAEIV